MHERNTLIYISNAFCPNSSIERKIKKYYSSFPLHIATINYVVYYMIILILSVLDSNGNQ